MGLRDLHLAAIIVLGVSPATLPATTLSFSGLGGNIVGASDDGTPGFVAFTIPVSNGSVLPLTGDNVTVTLVGLQYPWAGDLVVTLSFVGDGGTQISADVFNRIGKNPSDPDDLGYGTQFGNSSTGPSGTYSFNSSFSGNLWTIAAPLGAGDSIPSGAYWPTTSGSAAPDNLSSAFNGAAIAGTWQLTILDYGPLDTSNFTPGLDSWQIDFNVTAAPEPAMAIPLAALLGLAALRRRRGRPTARRPSFRPAA